MKRMLSFIVALSSLLSVSCSKEAEFPPKASFQVDAGQPSEFRLNKNAKTLTYTFTPQKDWTASVNSGAAQWCTITPTSGEGGKEATITIEVASNTDANVRKAIVTINTTDNASSCKITVVQSGHTEGAVSILAIGNSFSDDAMEYLYQILEDAGYTSIKLGNLYIGGCTLETHAANFANEAKAYDYRVNVDGKWVTTPKYSSVDAIKSEKWDYISMQQASGWSGVPASYDPHLANLVEGVSALSPESELVWHMTWAYQQNSTHSDFPKYDNDQAKMYQAIVSTAREKVLPGNSFVTLIPNGTVMQNIRTSFIGDTVTRDGYHLSYGTGRYAAALMWARQIAGVDVDAVTWTPDGQFFTPGQLKAVKEAVNNAYQKPFEVTESTFKEDDLAKMTLEEIIALAKSRRFRQEAEPPAAWRCLALLQPFIEVIVFVIRILLCMGAEEFRVPGVPVTRMIQRQVQDQLHASLMAQADQVLQVFHGAEDRIDPVIIRHVVFMIGRRLKNGGQPDSLNSEALPGGQIPVVQVIHPVDDPAQVPGPVSVRVGKGTHKDLIEHTVVVLRIQSVVDSCSLLFRVRRHKDQRQHHHRQQTQQLFHSPVPFRFRSFSFLAFIIADFIPSDKQNPVTRPGRRIRPAGKGQS